MKSLIEFMQEQDLVSARRLVGHAHPWTDDLVMQKYKFGNVRRELDRTNRLLYRLLHGPKNCDSFALPDAVANCLVHRLVSNHDFSERHGLFLYYTDFAKRYDSDRKCGLAVRPTSFISCMSDPRLLTVAGDCFANSKSMAEVILQKPTLKTAFRTFRRQVGKFTAWQAALDAQAYGWVTNSTKFVHLGPGADFSLRALDLSPGDYDTLVHQVNEYLEYLPLRYEEVEGLLCEYGRYIKYNTKWPGKYRLYTPDPRPLLPVPLDSVLLGAMKERL
jgi:hypothetical protein